LSRGKFTTIGKDQAHGGTVKIRELKVMSKRSIALLRAMLKKIEKTNLGFKISPWIGKDQAHGGTVKIRELKVMSKKTLTH